MYIIISFIVGIVVGALTSYLVLRNNADIKNKVDSVTNKVENTIK